MQGEKNRVLAIVNRRIEDEYIMFLNLVGWERLEKEDSSSKKYVYS